MDHVLSLVNFATSCAMAALTGWAVISPAVRDGVVVKAGLILMSAGHGIVALHLVDGITQADLMYLNRARFLINGGMLLVLGGYFWRHSRGERIEHIVPGLSRRRGS